ncbi:hypothetical protein ANCDUO_14335 [Ancylostoma duodenale]|uniref:Uncharacterized protein n=1 Tax=Ancylostoma duodenale TaxID=51022 RepID=A0A0C2CGL0_9BILA|nr:hypothetical protein ANCDUO_14335 [Ancylostoma duodenale]
MALGKQSEHHGLAHMHTGPESIEEFEETIDELKTAIFDAWEDTEVDSLKNLLHSMPRRLFEVASKEGGPIGLL